MELSQTQIKKIQDIQLKSISENKELGFLACNNNIYELNRSNNKDISLDVYMDNLKSTIKNCKNGEVLLGHTHATGSYNPSNIDYQTNDELLFLDGFCSAGVDKISCYNKNNEQIFASKSNNQFDNKFKKNGQIYVGNSLNCGKIKHNYKCSINEGYNNKDIGVFANIGSSGLVNYSKNKNIFISGYDGSNIKCYSGKNNLFCLNN